MLDVPHATGYVGCVGEDKYAETLRSVAGKDGVTCHYLVDPKVQTGTCAVLITEHERSVVANLAAAEHYKLDHLKSDAMQKVLAKCKYIYVEGYFLTSGFEAVMYAAEYANTHGKKFCLNLSADFICFAFMERLQKVLPYTDFIFGNESEAKAFATVMKYDVSVLFSFSSSFRCKNERNVVSI